MATSIAISLTTPVRHFNGSGNNLQNPSWGMSRSPYISGIVPFSHPPGPISEILPAARNVSNRLFVLQKPLDTEDFPETTTTLNDLFTAFGQFIAFDMTLTQVNLSDPAPITIPVDDWARPIVTSLPFFRSECVNYLNQRLPVNGATSFLDVEQIYGNSAERAAALRTFSGGQLRTSALSGLPFNDASSNTCGCPVSNPRRLDPASLRFGGSPAANNNMVTYALLVIFVREHNRQCKLLQEAFPSASDQELYERARLRVISTVQHITFYDFFPKLVGPLPAYTGYNSSLNPSVENFFGAVAFRYGHSAVRANIAFEDAEGIQSHLPLRTSLNTPPQDELVEEVLRGAIASRSHQVDLRMVDDLRGFFNSVAGLPRGDVAATEVQRGRDHGVPPYNEVRRAYGLDDVSSFDELTNDEKTKRALEELYGDISKLDAYVGMFAESPVPGLVIGPLAQRAIVEQVLRTRAADRFWFENTAIDGPGLTEDELLSIRFTTLGNVIASNTNLSAAKLASHFNMLGCNVRPSTNGGFTQSIDPFTRREVSWRSEGTDFVFTVTLPDDSWLAIGFGAEDGAMLNADIYSVHTYASSTFAGRCSKAGTLWLCDRSAYNWRYQLEPVPTDIELGGTSNAEVRSVTEVDGITTVEFTRPARAVDKLDNALDGTMLVTFAYGDGGFGYHRNRIQKILFNFADNSVLEGLADTNQLRLLHGAALTLAWGLMVPAAIFISRYAVHTSWFAGSHVALNIFALVITWAGFATARYMVYRHNTSPHAVIGLLMVIWATTHICVTVVFRTLRMFPRSCPWFSSQRYHKVSNAAHKLSGRSLFVLSAVQLYLGARTYYDLTGDDLRIAFYAWLGLLVSVFLVLEYLRMNGRRIDRFVLATTRKRPVLSIPRGCRWHLFLSHVWSSGQDQMAVVKRRMTQLLIGCKCFLVRIIADVIRTTIWSARVYIDLFLLCTQDVDDLKDISKLEEYIDQSGSILFFISSGYFLSSNCLREVRRTVEQRKDLIMLHEADEKKGGITLEEAKEECPSSLRDYIFESQRQIIPWHRLSAYQMHSLRLIAERLLIYSFHEGAKLTYRSEVSMKMVNVSQPCAIYVSDHNPGAQSLFDELFSSFKQVSKGSSLSQSNAFLLYLNRDTFVGDDGHLAELVRRARESKLPILLVHENSPDRGGVSFAHFFTTTPADLISGGLFHTLANPIFAEPHRELSIANTLLALNRLLNLQLSSPRANQKRQAAAERLSVLRKNMRNSVRTPRSKGKTTDRPQSPGEMSFVESESTKAEGNARNYA